LSFDEIDSAWNEGKKLRGIGITSIEQAYATRRNWRGYFHGL
jgi:hypothetical protein